MLGIRGFWQRDGPAECAVGVLRQVILAVIIGLALPLALECQHVPLELDIDVLFAHAWDFNANDQVVIPFEDVRRRRPAFAAIERRWLKRIGIEKVLKKPGKTGKLVQSSVRLAAWH